ncbi:broad substrate specificity ATP-binding cassette transporter ABCG2-like [Convolutriloba macropyga]|uniref:broad substrate specificity ATP-binding cassette transporter ABCG2-like n=1 Tax=Convolutriloba macropyga TaxID=536237 RepID=UPI003F51FAA5
MSHSGKYRVLVEEEEEEREPIGKTGATTDQNDCVFTDPFCSTSDQNGASSAQSKSVTEQLIEREKEITRRRVTSKGSTVELSRSFFLRQKSAEGFHTCLSFHDVNYSVKVSNGWLKSTEHKQILRNVNGIFKPGLNAIMGPTGSGKTTLLDLLAMRKDPEGFSGSILLEGQTLPKDFKLISCYVVQDDVVKGTLTVKENLMFSAKLRLRGKQRLETEIRVEQVLLDLGLEKCADTLVGTNLIKGVSGGERKRCNIGVELLTQPSVLFLDEPTTGLDSTTAFNVMNHLKSLASHGRTVIFSIHQPRYSIFKLFDKLHLISKGHTAYHGPANRALDFFASCGFPCDSFNNPPDFFLDAMMECEGMTSSGEGGGVTVDTLMLKRERSRTISEQTRQYQLSSGQHHLTASYRRSKSGYSVRSDLDKGVDKNYDLAGAFKTSEYNKKLQDDLTKERAYSRDLDSDGKLNLGRFEVDYPVNFFLQVFYICQRLYRNTKRNPGEVVSQVLVATMFGLVGGVFFFGTGDDYSTQSGYQNRQGVAFFTVANSMFGGVAVVTIFVTERSLFLHESANGFYRISSYFLSKFIMDVIPLRTIPTIIYAILLYWMTGLKPELDSFLLYMLTACLVAVSSCSAGLAVSATFNVIPVAILSVTTTYVLMLMFGGFYIDVDNIPIPLTYLQYLSVIRYGISAIQIVELRDEVFTNSGEDGTNITKSGEDYLVDAGIKFGTDWDYWQNQVGLTCIMVGSLLITYIRLRLIKKLK